MAGGQEGIYLPYRCPASYRGQGIAPALADAAVGAVQKENRVQSDIVNCIVIDYNVV